MPTEFHLFPALPTELRQEIGDLAIAIRPRRAGVRVFRVFDASQEPSIQLKNVSGFAPYRTPLALGIPLPDKDFASVTGESISDISTQVHDPELWNTCQESRLMMRKAFVSRKGYSFDSMGYYLSGSAPFYVTITKPGHSLFILRPDSLEFDFREIYGAFSETDLVLGIEYKPEWGSQLYAEEQGGEICQAARLITGLGWDQTVSGVCLVDYNLKLKADSPYRPRPEDLGCYYARDRRLVEADPDDERKEEHWEYIDPIPDGDYRKSSFYFAKRMVEAFDEVGMDDHEATFGPWIDLLGWDDF
ncbi:uncharacterized protein FPRO_14491 [Fusarium proliferatum ET1]|uniref:2EXR domain-containing protein n=1 Tax=Fusarium proliferatum (strain ET1) TaxID=1227346 RepID=A0A1L7VWC3_FUSPR|nr:uncharacterized protein FPRO_14491 [Fusarium proliferatum ET1]CZR44738.1 uncharacterized protein FPRO_14491 [Fusarium proliferatum ET1]